MRKITSLTLLVSGIIELITSVVLYIVPAGRVAYWSDYHLLGLSKQQWADIHITVGTLFLVMSCLHLYYNWGAIKAFLRNKARQLTVFNKNFLIALAISLYVTAGTLFHLPPMHSILQLGEHFTERANQRHGEPPYGHAELSSLKMFCQKMDIDPATAKKQLAAAGIQITSDRQTILEIANLHNITPQQLYTIFKPAQRQLSAGPIPFPDSPVPGFGRTTLNAIGEKFCLSVPLLLQALEEEGIKATPNESLKEIAANNNTSPMALFEILHEAATTE